MKDWQPTYKGVWDAVANFAPWPLPCPRPGASIPTASQTLLSALRFSARSFSAVSRLQSDRDALTAYVSAVVAGVGVQRKPVDASTAGVRAYGVFPHNQSLIPCAALADLPAPRRRCAAARRRPGCGRSRVRRSPAHCTQPGLPAMLSYTDTMLSVAYT